MANDDASKTPAGVTPQKTANKKDEASGTGGKSVGSEGTPIQTNQKGGGAKVNTPPVSPSRQQNQNSANHANSAPPIQNINNTNSAATSTPGGNQGNQNQNQGTPQVVYLQAPAQISTTDLTPYQGFKIDPNTKEGLSFWKEASKPPLGWKFTKLNTSSRPLYLEAIRAWAEKYGAVVLKIPTQGDGQVSPVPRQVAGVARAGFNLAGYVDVLDDKKVRLDDLEESAKAYSNWFFGGPAALFQPSTQAQRVAIAIDPAAQGNEGLVNQEKLRLRRESALLFQFLQNLAGVANFKQFRLHKADYTLALEEDEKQEVRCGCVLFALMEGMMKPSTKIDTANLEEKLRLLVMADFSDVVPDLFAEMEDLRGRIEAERGYPYDKDVYLTLLFAKVEPYQNQAFNFEVRLAKREWTKANTKTNPAAVIAELTSAYNNLVKEKKWGKTDPGSDQKIIALTAEVKKLQKSNSKLLKNGAAARNDNDSNAGGRGANGGARGQGGNGGGGRKAPDWQITNVGPETIHPKFKTKMVWCPHHKSKDGVVNGMYMRAPHDHDEWLARRKQHQKERQDKKKFKKKNADASTQQGDDAKRQKTISPGKLSLAKSFQSAYCSRFILSEEDAEPLTQKVLAEHCTKAQSKD